MIEQRLRPSEYITITFALILLILSLIIKNRIEDKIFTLVPIYLSIIAIQFLRMPGPTRDIMVPSLSVIFIFDSLEWIVHPLNPVDIDPLLLELDYLLTGTYPTIWLQRFINPLLTEIMQLAYTSYYFMPLLLAIFLKMKKRQREFDEALFLILLCFYLSYIGYMLFPALGPRFYIGHLHTVELKGLLLMESIHELLNKLEGIKRDPFPSGHTAIALLCLILSYRFERRLFWCLFPVVILLIASTVYLGYHYVVDIIAGIILTLFVIIVGPFLYQAMKGMVAKATVHEDQNTHN